MESQEERARIASALLPFPAIVHIIAVSYADRNHHPMNHTQILRKIWGVSNDL